VAEQGGPGHRLEKTAIKASTWVLNHPDVLAAAERLASKTRALHPKKLPGPGARQWTESRDLPKMPDAPFRDWWKKNRTGDRP
ncbi:lactate utilization protein LutB domain-containing protein, partial [Streptomyces sp. NPDC015661]|uniref:lactate utilisation protein LutB domain-containing protein n=1 Tax=Streptomyces sp. NPDC015661 TaxID=3364961 RepID=UPI0036FB6A65